MSVMKDSPRVARAVTGLIPRAEALGPLLAVSWQLQSRTDRIR